MDFGGACEPQDVGLDAGRLGAAIELVEARGAIAQLCVVRDGQIVVDRSFGCLAGRVVLAVLRQQAVRRRSSSISWSSPAVLHLDDAVAAYWSGFAHNGKREITVRQVLRHRSGVSTAGSYLGDVRAMTDWDRSLRRIEDAKPRWPIGTVAYSPLAFGFILGEVAHRCSGRPIEELATALRPRTTRGHRHLPRIAGGRVGSVRPGARRRTGRPVRPVGREPPEHAGRPSYPRLGSPPPRGTWPRCTRPCCRAVSVRPAGSCGRRRWRSRSSRAARARSTGGAGADPLVAGVPARRPAHRPGRGQLRSGRRAARATFGHNGSNCCVGWADPDRADRLRLPHQPRRPPEDRPRPPRRRRRRSPRRGGLIRRRWRAGPAR